MQRTVFFISDGTGITANALGRSLLSQFREITFERITLPYIDSPEKAAGVVQRIEARALEEELPPLVFFTVANAEVRHVLTRCPGLRIDIFGSYLGQLQEALGSHPANATGEGRLSLESDTYRARVEAVNFALKNDDGGRTLDYDRADVILTGVSRTGKTPTCLYLALQFGIRAANYPLTADDLDETRLPPCLAPYRHKVFGLTIEPELLSAIREERRPGSGYASLRQCLKEVNDARAMFQLTRIPHLDTSHLSIEEMATRIIAEAGLTRRFK